MNIYIESVYIAIIAYVYSVVLTDAGMLLNKPYLFLERVLPAWLFSPLMGCCYCVTGQMALWYYLFVFWNKYKVFDHIFFVSFAIICECIIIKILTYNERT